MTNTPGSYEADNPEVTPQALDKAFGFITALNNFNWRTDYIKFWKVLDYTPDDWAESEYKQFQELINYLGRFDKEAIALMIEVGK
ncbi:hypothetical protein H6G74_16885 [Nostoc spongiaeforme FACHB-130]|uniref:Uncharacterized protein n=1 Tax=Nostoc spongiaeforme FACHB-130 TaxID=1357510 RepID=A0ABR8FYZ6_9NOSO|nr:hypothetical protein [Nostoc spongiaeforme]MBD2595991.1 hypothetical protein [Nostoc spongiaeforme FACHB-130]